MDSRVTQKRAKLAAAGRWKVTSPAASILLYIFFSSSSSSSLVTTSI